jgi:hypothetical protein
MSWILLKRTAMEEGPVATALRAVAPSHRAVAPSRCYTLPLVGHIDIVAVGYVQIFKYQ